MATETDLLLRDAQDGTDYALTNVSTYCTKHATTGVYYIPFDDTAVESILFSGTMPQWYDSAQTLKLDIYYYASNAGDGDCEFEVSVEAVTHDVDTLDMDSATSFDTANSGSDTCRAMQGHPALCVVTLATKDSVAAGDKIRIILERDANDATNDDQTGDINVTGIRLYQST